MMYIRQIQILVQAQICTWLIVYTKKQQIPPDLLFFSVYMSVKNTLLSEFFSEALVILVKKLVNLFNDLLHNSHP